MVTGKPKLSRMAVGAFRKVGVPFSFPVEPLQTGCKKGVPFFFVWGGGSS